MKRKTRKNNKKMLLGIHIFNSDLRVFDNTSLNHLSSKTNKIIPIFIYTPEQIKDSVVFNTHSLQVLYESLKDLDEAITKRGGKLRYFVGKTGRVLSKLLDDLKDEYKICVCKNNDFSEYARKRDKEIEELCISKGVDFVCHRDQELCDIEKTKKDGETYYSKFTYFYDKAVKLPVRKPTTNTLTINSALKNGSKIEYESLSDGVEYLSSYIENKKLHMMGGRKNALNAIKQLKNQNNYQKTRDYMIKETSGLSAHHKYGTISIRESYQSMKKLLGLKNGIIRQLYWRDFYYTVALKFSEDYKQSVYTWQSRNKSLGKESHFIAWKEGKTGFPLVDAGMRQMNETGFMHNRARMTTASLLIKTLLINWRKGERYFAIKLGDYDFCMNFGNWCWVAGNLPHSQAPFRTLSPWAQAEKYDKECKYIKKWIPELKDVPPEHILKWNEYCQEYKNINYPKPIVDYKKNREIWMKSYKQLLK
jgi:deoxyribodipyrimidine photo-lyase